MDSWRLDDYEFARRLRYLADDIEQDLEGKEAEISTDNPTPTQLRVLSRLDKAARALAKKIRDAAGTFEG